MEGSPMRMIAVALGMLSVALGSTRAFGQAEEGGSCSPEGHPPVRRHFRSEVQDGPRESWRRGDTGRFLADVLFGRNDAWSEPVPPPDFREHESAPPPPEGPHWEVNPRTGGIEYYDGEGDGPAMVEALPRRTRFSEEDSSAREATLRAIEMAENRRIPMNRVISDLEFELDSCVGLMGMGGSPEALIAILADTGRVLAEAARMGSNERTLAGELRESMRRHPEEARVLRALPADAPLWRRLTEWSEESLDVLHPDEARLMHRRMQLIFELRRQLGGQRLPAPDASEPEPAPTSPEPPPEGPSPAADEARVPLRTALHDLASMAPHCCTGLEDCERAVKALLMETERLLEGGHAGSIEDAFREARDAMAADRRHVRDAQGLRDRAVVDRGTQFARDHAQQLAEGLDPEEAARGRQQLRILDALERALFPEPVEVEPR